MIKKLTIQKLVEEFPELLGEIDKQTFINLLVPLHTDLELFDVYYKGNKLHNVNGPAICVPGLAEYWYLNDKLHNPNGPAVVRADGYQEWWLKGKLHNPNGPAIIRSDGSREWWLDGEQIKKPE